MPGLRIVSAGTFTITATSDNIISSTSSSLTITNYVYSISLTPSTLTLSQNFPITITAVLKGEDNNIFQGSATLALSESTNSLSGIKSLNTSTGICIFTLHFTSIGTKNIIATSSLVTNTISITVLSLMLKIISLSPIVLYI